MDYKETLNLPQTNFPMKANLVKKEPDILAQWDKEHTYASIREKLKGKPKFIFQFKYVNEHLTKKLFSCVLQAMHSAATSTSSDSSAVSRLVMFFVEIMFLFSLADSETKKVTRLYLPRDKSYQVKKMYKFVQS